MPELNNELKGVIVKSGRGGKKGELGAAFQILSFSSEMQKSELTQLNSVKEQSR